jgi:DNA-binding MarR family transcriptional regulator
MAADRGALRKRSEDSSTGAPLEGLDETPAEAEALELDRLIHERVRLGIVSSLAVNGWLTFTDLRDLLGITDGNLSAHARRLEEAGYVECKKSFDGRTPKTEFGLTSIGRRELESYLDHMEAIIQATRDAPMIGE